MFGTEAAIHRGVGGYQILNSCLFVHSSNSHLRRTPPQAGNRKKWAFSGWYKQGDSYASGSSNMLLSAGTDNAIRGTLEFGYTPYINFFDSATVTNRRTNGEFREYADWIHIVVIHDTDQAVARDRVKLYIDGVLQTDFHTVTDPVLGAANGFINSTVDHRIGARLDNIKRYDGYMADLVFLDGVDATIDDFGRYNRKYPTVWQPKDTTKLDYSGVNSFHLDFSDPANIGKDVSGNGNSFTVQNLTSNNIVIDSPTNNFATINPAHLFSGTALVQGNRRFNTFQAITQVTNARTTMSFNSGKWYFETRYVRSTIQNQGFVFGIEDYDAPNGTYNTASKISFATSNTTITAWNRGVNAGNTGVVPVSGDIFGISIDFDNGFIYLRQNGTLRISLAIVATKPMFVIYGDATSSEYYTVDFNAGTFSDFGGAKPIGTFTDENGYGLFQYQPPAGYLAMCSQNFPEPAVANPKEFFDPVIYTGDGVDGRIIPTQNIVNHIVTKNRTSAMRWNDWNSVVSQGLWPAKNLSWDNTDQEYETWTHPPTPVGETGFKVSIHQAVNGVGDNYVAYPFTKSLIAGTDIVLYTGDGSSIQSIPHTLDAPPEFVIIKKRTGANDSWSVYHENLTRTKKLLIDTADLATDTSNYAAEPDEFNFYVGQTNQVNQAGHTYVMYLFKEIAGFSKVFNYAGNGSADGPFIYCGFKPAMVLLKCRSSGYNWNIMDNQRDPYSPAENTINPNLSSAEVDSETLDFVSNGFTLRTNATWMNASGQNYIGIAFAEAPFGMRGK